tara:strand:+ start:329147 stop:329929 length:783 start_codon:yes stop_codon:yes gene_type:complete
MDQHRIDQHLIDPASPVNDPMAVSSAPMAQELSDVRDTLARRLRPDSPPLPRSDMSPSLSYGRHRGPWRYGSRHAAVLIAIYRDQKVDQRQGQWTIPLTRRPSTLKHHGGQICLPGGQVERGENALQAALREFEEELGVTPEQVFHCGELDTQYVYNSDNRVHPVVVLISPPRQPWRPDPVEVSEVITLPVKVLSSTSNRCEYVKERPVRKKGTQIGSFQFRAATIEHKDHQIWGATALILDQFARVIRDLRMMLPAGFA